MKTQCPHCQTKFNAPDKHKGKKVKCPKCGQLFVIALFSEAAGAEVCTNCGRAIGKLEQPCVFKDEIVFSECDQKLRKTKDDSENGAASENVVQASETEDSYGGLIRLSFFGLSVALNTIYVIISVLIVNAFPHAPYLDLIWLLVYLFLLFLVLQSRLINIGYNQWWALLLCVPIFNFLLVLGCIILPEGFKDSHKFDYTGLILVAIFIVVSLALVAITI